MMKNTLQGRADTVIAVLNSIPAIKKCTVYGSLSADTYDEMSDIDIEVDVSGYDNGQFMLELPDLLQEKLHIYYSDFAPSLIPDRYIVSVALDEENPFLMVDLCCTANPHCTSVTKQQVMEKNRKYTHTLKLWTANLKHYARGRDCSADIVRMGRKLGIADIDAKSDAAILRETLCWLEDHAESGLEKFVVSCRCMFEKYVNLICFQ